MLIYEVNLDVDAEVAEAYESWLRVHIDELLTLPGFVEARWYRRDAEAEGVTSRGILWTVHYVLEDLASYERYLREDAPRMREDGMRRFGGRFQASRRVLWPALEEEVVARS